MLNAHLYSVSSRRAYNGRGSSPCDVVEDSEPERDAQRRRAAATQSAGNGTSTIVAASHVPLGPAKQVIEVLDDSPPPERLTSHAAARDSRATTPPSSLVVEDSTNASDSDSDPAIRFDIARFQHQPSWPSQAARVSSTSTSERSTSVDVELITDSRKQKSIKYNNFLFSDHQLSKLDTCIGCEVKWTARKTTAQKMSHIAQCTKKRAFTEETVRALIQQQLDRIEHSPPLILGAKGRKQREKQKTYLESVVQENDGKKKGKRANVSSAVLPLATTREAILERSNLVLRDSGAVSPEPTVARGRNVVHSQLLALQQDNARTPQAINFASGISSSLPTTEQQPRKLYAAASSSTYHATDTSDDLPPATQAMPPSRFSSLARNPLLGVASAAAGIVPTVPPPDHLSACSLPDSDDDLSAVVISSREPSASPRRRLKKSRSRERTQISQTAMRTMISASPSSASDSSHHDMWSDSGAILVGGAEPTSELTRRRSKSLAGAAKTKTKSRKEPAPAKPLEDLDTVMRQCILNDDELYMRILRYEPIHIGVFAKLAMDHGFSERTLFTKLRTFLDTEAINFHTNDSTKARRRQR